jgi:hypothetical protein
MYPWRNKEFTELVFSLPLLKRCVHLTSRRLFHARIPLFQWLIASVRLPTWSLTKILCCSL